MEKRQLSHWVEGDVTKSLKQTQHFEACDETPGVDDGDGVGLEFRRYRGGCDIARHRSLDRLVPLKTRHAWLAGRLKYKFITSKSRPNNYSERAIKTQSKRALDF